MSNVNHEQPLKQFLVKYKYPDIAKCDVLNVFTPFPDLRPKHEEFVYNDGTKKMLINLDGTIPVNYKGSVYNIPIGIWLSETHPYSPPMVFVKPTQSMLIKPGRNVDVTGRIDLPYLKEWKYPDSDLLGMIQILTIVFGEEPPVYSKSQSAPPRYQPTSQTPYPTQAGSSFPMPMPSVGGTPYTSNLYPNSAPYPQTNYPSSNYSGQYPAGQTGGYQGYPLSYPASTATPSYPGNTVYPPAYSQAVSDTYPPVHSGAPNYLGNNTVTEEHLRASLLSAVEDKMKWRLKETFAQAQAEMDVLYKTRDDLSIGKTKLQQMIQDLEQEKLEIERNKELLKQINGEVQDTLGRLEKSGQLSIDEAVVTTAPLYRQLLKCFAEEQALEDAIYYLGEALRRNVIDLEVFLKQVRELSRKQFMLRALIHKCREKAGLPPIA